MYVALDFLPQARSDTLLGCPDLSASVTLDDSNGYGGFSLGSTINAGF